MISGQVISVKRAGGLERRRDDLFVCDGPPTHCFVERHTSFLRAGLAGSWGVGDRRDCAFLLGVALCVDYFMSLGGLSDCVHVEIGIRSVGVAQLEASMMSRSKSP
jgi:hypothetical protein